MGPPGQIFPLWIGILGRRPELLPAINAPALKTFFLAPQRETCFENVPVNKSQVLLKTRRSLLLKQRSVTPEPGIQTEIHCATSSFSQEEICLRIGATSVQNWPAWRRTSLFAEPEVVGFAISVSVACNHSPATARDFVTTALDKMTAPRW